MTLSRFLRSPRWVAGHVLVLVTVVLFAGLGAWQLERLDSRRDYNALLGGRMEQAPVPLGDLSAGTGSPAAIEADGYRRVTATGTFRHEDEILLSTRSHDGRPGHHVLTPLVTDGTVLLVDRGWVPLDRNQPPIADAAPPQGPVTVRGVLFPSQEARTSGTFDGRDGVLQFVSHVDLPVLARALDERLYPLYLLAQEQTPGQPGALPVQADLPELTEGSHLSYAGQWFLFALVVAFGYPYLLRRSYLDQRDGASPVGRPAPSTGPERSPVASG